MLKGQNEKLTNKKFYMWMLSGVLVVICICTVSLNIVGPFKEKKQDYADLKEPVVENEISTKDSEAKKESTDKVVGPEVQVSQEDEKVNLLENDIVDDGQQEDANKVEAETTESEPESVSVMSNSKKNIFEGLSFDEEKGLTWPVKGNVVLKYSMDKPIYFATLQQYKHNDAMCIAAEEGTNIVSAADGVVTKIYENEETGKTLEMAIDKDYYVTYGQLKDVCVKEGDKLTAGQKIASVAKPTKYYVSEGSNVYLKIVHNELPVNPMDILD